MLRILNYSVVLILASFSFCRPPQGTATPGLQKYSEDLSVHRPQVADSESDSITTTTPAKRDTKAYVEPIYTVNKQLDTVLDSISRINLTRKFVEGYTIQVYSGLNREEALNAKKNLMIFMPKIEADVHYNQPNFRVKAGRYMNTLDAQKDYQQIKKFFPNAIIVPDKIAVN